MENNHVYSPAQAGLSHHIQSINALIERLRRAEIKVEQYQVSIGRHIAAIKTARPDDWEDVVKTECNLSRSRAYELMAIADGSKTIEQTRDQANARKIKHRKSVRSGTDNVGERPADSKGRKQPAHRTTSAPSEAKSHKIKFTPERIAQIKNLIERGMSREEIAEIIGVTVGSLQVTCSHLGLSLRRPRLAMTTTPPSSRDSGATDTRKSDDISPSSASEVERLRAHNEELENEKRRLEIENTGSRSEVEETKAVRKPEGEGEGSELGNLLRAWDRASQGAREKFKARVGLVAVEPPAKVMDDGLDIPESLRRAAP
jgi:hypothetical protein